MSESSKFAKQIRIDSTTEESYKTLNPTQKRSYRDQVKYLTCYTETRSKSVSASYASVTVRTVDRWRQENRFGFAERLSLKTAFNFSKPAPLLKFQKVMFGCASLAPLNIP